MKFVEGRTVGIDLGTTFSTLAYLDEQGNATPVQNDDGEVETPSLVLFTEDGQVIVGPSRQRAAMEDPTRIVERIKREMGNMDFRKVVDGQEMTPEFISALILKKLRQDAERRIGPIGNAVITVPYYFNDARRKATQDAGRIAGLNVVDIINEPTAATLTYAWDQGKMGTGGATKETKVLVYDLGGGTFDVTLVKFTPTNFEVLATDGDVHLGGVDWTDRIMQHVAKEFKDKHGIDPLDSPQTTQVLRSDCDQAKINLSTGNMASIICRCQGKAASVKVSRDLFHELTADLLQRTLDTTELVLDMAKLSAKEVDSIVLVGGSTLMPKVRDSLEQLTGVKPFTGLSPHTAVAQGAAIHAAILEAKHREGSPYADALKKRLAAIKQEDVNSHSLGVVIKDRQGKKRNVIMIPRNSKIPVEVRKTFNTVEENQRRVTVQVVEGDAPDPDACSLIGKCTIYDLPEKLPKHAQIEVCYSFTAQGRVVVSARDVSSNKQAKIEIERGGLLSDQQVDSYARLASDYKVE